MTKQLLCPKDQTPLKAEIRFEIEVDVCPSCQGMWLDRNELNNILRISRGERPRKNSLVDTAGDVALVAPGPSSSASSKNELLAGVAEFFEGFIS